MIVTLIIKGKIMKKIFAILAFAAMTLSASAQGLKSFDGKLFSCQYPANFEAQEQWLDEAFNAKVEDGIEFMELSLGDYGKDMTVAELKKYSESAKYLIERSMGEPTGWKCGPTTVEGKTFTFRAEGEEEVDDKKVPAVKYSFGILTPKKKMFLGTLRFLKKDEAKYKPLVDKIIASCKDK